MIAFKDNSSAIIGADVTPLLPEKPGFPGPLAPVKRTWDLLLTAETHNFPCAVAPFPGAETGSGGRIRDTHATGTGSIMGAASAGYCVGNLQVQLPEKNVFLNSNSSTLYELCLHAAADCADIPQSSSIVTAVTVIGSFQFVAIVR